MFCSRSFRQLRLLLWKNFLLHWRQRTSTIIELLLPIGFSMLLVLIRTLVDTEHIKEPTTWPAFNISDLPSPKILPSQRLWNLAFTPDTAVTRSIMENVINTTGNRFNYSLGFSSETAMVNHISNNSLIQNILGGIVFKNFPTSGGMPWNMTYKIRLSYRPKSRSSGGGGDTNNGDWQTQLTSPVFQTIGPREQNAATGGRPGYYREGFLTLQYHIDRAMMSLHGVTNMDEVYMRRIPYPPYIRDFFILAIQTQFAFFLILGFVYASLNITKNVCQEKEQRLKETMRMMGLESWLHWTAWFVDYFIKWGLTSLAIAVICKIPIGSHGQVLNYSSFSVFLVFLLLYSTSLIFFCFAISTFFKTARGGATAGCLIFLLSYFPYSFLEPRYATLSLAVKVIPCILPNMALSLGGQKIGQFEGTGAGIQWSNFFSGPSVDDNFSMGHICLMMIIGSVFFMLVAWYKETVSPGEYGIPQPWYFPFTSSYWCGTRPVNVTVNSEEQNIDLDGGRRNGSITNANIEADPHGLNCTVSLRNLRRVFKGGSKTKVAVKDLSLNIYEGQITALLGHNGAGKSTTMSMIAGFIPSSGGKILVNGMDIQHNLTAVRKQLGLCPQHDVLFDTLTVYEHLQFFARLKNYDEKKLDEEINRLITATNLKDKRDKMAMTLSGGMKRRLSVAIALVGGSQVVILDEPTSGLDPSARRELWTFLQQERSRCTMLLSTHFMDEADFLGDRIAIMASGELQCCGSSLFLKSRYGAGYHLTLVKAPGCKTEMIEDLVKQSVPEAKVESHVGDEFSFILPTEASPKFEALFSKLENESADLGISSYGASVTTMEEVFLRVGEHKESEDANVSENVTVTLNGVDGNGFTSSTQELVGTDLDCAADYIAKRNRGFRLLMQQIRGIFVKRMIHSMRNYIISATQLIIPILFTAIGLLVLKTQPGASNLPELVLNLNNYGRQVLTVATSPSATANDLSLSASYAKVFGNRPLTTIVSLTNVNASTLQQRLAAKGDGDIAHYNSDYLLAAFFAPGKATALFNNQPFHTPAISLNAMSNAMLRRSYPNASITTINAPLPMSDTEKVSSSTNMFEGFGTAINVVFGLGYLAASFSFFIVKERVTKVKLLHFVSGTGKSSYWVATFWWDFINFLIPMIGIIIVFLIVRIDAYVSSAGRVFGLILLFLLYGWAIIPQTYNLSSVFSVPSSALSWLTAGNVMTGLASLLTVLILQLPQLNLQSTADVLKVVFTIIFPNFCLGQALVDYYTNYVYSSLCDTELITDLCKLGVNLPCCKDNCEPNCISWTRNFLGVEKGGIGIILIALAAQGIINFWFCLFFESSFAARIWAYLQPGRYASPNTEIVSPVNEGTSSSPVHIKEDSDVAAERYAIKNSDIHALKEANTLILSEVTHMYGRHRAVDRLSCSIQSGDCFGLLGVNGAGKTTTFKMITGDLPVSGGDVYINGHSVTKNVTKVRRSLGYCPQFDGLIDHLTGRETLYLFARLRGLKEHLIKTEVNFLIQSLLLGPHADRLTGTYSGGNKRKLSTAMALVGGPSVVCLDEPTTGMDPVARRHLWGAVNSFRERGHTLVLTSHSMEECEALCTKISIMVNGQFKCFGSCQHLKAKFGSGYSLLLQVPYSLEAGVANVQRAQEFVEGNFPSAELKDVHQGILHYHLHSDPNVTWSRVFGLLERNKTELMLENYSVSQTTLEQVFLGFARSQIPPDEKKFSYLTSCWQCMTCRRNSDK